MGAAHRGPVGGGAAAGGECGARACGRRAAARRTGALAALPRGIRTCAPPLRAAPPAAPRAPAAPHLTSLRDRVRAAGAARRLAAPPRAQTAGHGSSYAASGQFYNIHILIILYITRIHHL